jgi:ABC-type phosphate transport system substrate-binding protein
MKLQLKRVKQAVVAISALSLLLISTAALSDVVVIVNPKAGVSSLTAREVKAIFMGKKHSFPNGNNAEAVDQEDGSASKRLFLKSVINKSDVQLSAYWSQQIFSGKGVPPKTLKDDAAVKAYVASTPGALGYIDSSKVDGSVTVVYTAK